MTLPLLISVPHGGLVVPQEVADQVSLSAEDVVMDSDEGAPEIYDFAKDVEVHVKAAVARAIVDLNRPEDDFRPDGVIKTETSYQVPVWKSAPDESLVGSLLSDYYHPYHQTLAMRSRNVLLSVDCHTMAAVGPPIGPGAGVERPAVCLSDGDGSTLPEGWMDELAGAFSEAFGVDPAINDPFRGGHITRSHGEHSPWLQVELSRGPFATNGEKREMVLAALRIFCGRRATAGES